MGKMITTLGLSVPLIGLSIVNAIAAPKFFVCSLILGTVVGTVAAIGNRVFSGKSLEADSKDKEILTIPLMVGYLPYITSLGVFGTLISGYLIYARTVAQAVSPIFSYLGGVSALLSGFSLGASVGLGITDKIITVIDQRQLKTAHV